MRRSGTNGEVERRGGPYRCLTGGGKAPWRRRHFRGVLVWARHGVAWRETLPIWIPWAAFSSISKLFGPAFAEPAQLLVPASWPNCQIVDLRFRHYGSAFQASAQK